MATADDALGGRYRLEEPLGAGGMATVQRAYDLLLGRQVAVKILAANIAASPGHLERFGREARAMATITHPNLVAIYDVGWTDDQSGAVPYLVMELVTGGTLAERLAEGPLDPPEVVAIVEGLASALDALHRAGIVHRDVKPQNVLLAEAGPKLADLGIARVEDPSDPDAAALTASGAIPGTLRFLAPEVLFGQAASPKADAYALAMVAYEALTGRSARPAMTLGELVHEAWQPVVPVSTARPELGPVFDDVFAAALDLDPSRRLEALGFAAELWEAVAAWVALQPVAATPAIADADATDAGATDADAAVADAETDSGAAAPTEIAVPPGVAPPPGAKLPSGDQPLTGVARPNPLAFRPDDNTRAAADSTTFARLPRPGAPVSRVLTGLGVLTFGVGAIVVVLLLVRACAAPGTPLPSGSEPVATSSAGPASPTPSASSTDSVIAAAVQAVADVNVAIERARGGKDGLTGAEANDLTALANSVRQALEAGDYAVAKERASKLADRAEKFAKELDKTRREALLSAIEALRDAIPPA